MANKDQTMALLTLMAAVFALNPADAAGFQGAQQKVNELKDDMSPQERTKFDEVLDKVIEARNTTLPGRGFNSLTSGYAAPSLQPAPAEPEPTAPAAEATSSAGTTSTPAAPAAD